ncbi:ras-like GTP-binding protein Rho1 [Lingula anatina]|uniref:Ras-like GTP-binding protein Rho1 n=1 Tax=Lingula anatina TaxID=7574 RepID=A0A1S3HRY4_LINAN|nr:ras-like GTP-binding protein Rho1 [Lingula anatina]|eukprot:XP_013388306.1 ras-like GTP-binding protein Rho1 [Lingula anatina]
MGLWSCLYNDRSSKAQQPRKTIIILGDEGCGKSCQVSVFTKDDFAINRLPVPSTSNISYIEIDGKMIELILREPAGLDDVTRLNSLSGNKKDAVLLCYSIDNPCSFRNASYKWAPEINKRCPDVPIVLVGNKKDLQNDKYTICELGTLHEEPIGWQAGQKMAEKINAFSYMECSAKTREGIRELFETAARTAVLKKKCPTVVRK